MVLVPIVGNEQIHARLECIVIDVVWMHSEM